MEVKGNKKVIIVSPAKQKRDIRIAFRVLSSSSASAVASAQIFVPFLCLGHFLRNYNGCSHVTWVVATSGRVKLKATISNTS